jgi:hypothetical protein
MKLVVCESPYRAETPFELRRNLAYARALVHHFTMRGFSAHASHLLYTQCLDDRDPEQRRLGIEAGLALLRVADVHAFGIDLGISHGMTMAMEKAKASVEWGMLYEEVSLPEWAEAMAHCRSYEGSWDTLNALVNEWAPKWHVHEVSR